MNNILHFLFGRGWFILLYAFFYFFIILPLFWPTGDLKSIVKAGEYTGPGYGMWAFISAVLICWSLLFLSILINILLIHSHHFTFFKLLIVAVLFVIFSYIVFNSDRIFGDRGSFFVIIATAILSIITNYFVLWQLQQ